MVSGTVARAEAEIFEILNMVEKAGRTKITDMVGIVIKIGEPL